MVLYSYSVVFYMSKFFCFLYLFLCYILLSLLICEVLLICSVNSCSFFAYELYISVTYIGWYFILTVLYFTCQNSFVFYIFFYVTFCSVCSFVVSCSFAHLIYVHYMLLLFISIIFFSSDDPEYIWVGELTHFGHVQ